MSEWANIKLGDVADITSSKRIFYSDYVASGIPFFRSKEIIELEFGFKIEEPLYISHDKFESIRNKYGAPQDGDLLISAVGERSGIPFVVNNLGPFYFKDGNLIWIRNISSRLNANFLYRWIKSYIGQRSLESIMIGSAQKALTIEGLKSLQIPLPPIPQQQAIADVLSSLDAKIDLLHRQNATLEEMAETLFRQWFIEDARDGWNKGNLIDEFTITMGQSPAGSSYNEHGQGMPMFQGNADFGFRFPTNRVYTTAPMRLAQRFDTLISVRAPVGEQNMAWETCCIGRGVAAIRYKENPSLYTYTFFKIRSLMQSLKAFNNEGTVFGSITKTDLEALSVALPPTDLINQFEQQCKPINDKIIHNTQQIQKLEHLRDTLLPKLMSGEIRVAY
ncbi:restriction endonuclease subunit S [Herpetosiphon geysericola]|uniref:Type I restriction modification DNA specificity domain-containing protein n=1 Tax=Herpetosiphon geysericola TaxID=70996 RepID=A0A0N8GQ90_9CHLR|nr:restriction endonuclease subunit S [Herpetosiphon geysericola]KPL83034.1 hypothetical protein SE18_19520 [Herpetosiphon geysericola]